ncbi:MAG: hypothetical protein A3H88_02355 [Candidatus Blackburnbacteria bacterium RIFCSPLOWO2_02_FULL_44_9]|uniref:Uncharacterized protein n=1 Tax=Candidatus Blackburnbacteria bacterium RIFCSPHIGHO2_02_FULL_44_20 TaxID=1797516 RepID=A0A1G1V698_9BACT|nr:MAG: hypothetical protein A3E16_03110 [Candidatus Blackburnbacteria bacterium RIFCSPHIGHO2_12_FULL_44_25]OGY10899.1 MAG: hypothetical protein A3D26_01680 [Candidatus Blackburnbacteria bacterium RIFCSPHIGHO2_02_FULL_44_20]OGY15907.1 MAG: hypothetical protein A3H88_02355 [Candidatus Blackburnbacteria bacterium RIFCSPLOWO2_02_FULL_44_9]
MWSRNRFGTRPTVTKENPKMGTEDPTTQPQASRLGITLDATVLGKALNVPAIRLHYAAGVASIWVLFGGNADDRNSWSLLLTLLNVNRADARQIATEMRLSSTPDNGVWVQTNFCVTVLNDGSPAAEGLLEAVQGAELPYKVETATRFGLQSTSGAWVNLTLSSGLPDIFRAEWERCGHPRCDYHQP